MRELDNSDLSPASHWVLPPIAAPRQVLGAMINETKQAFHFTVPAHILSVVTVILDGQILIERPGDEPQNWQELPKLHASGGFTHSNRMMASSGTQWLSLFARADTWAILSDKHSAHFTDRLFAPQQIAGLWPSGLPELCSLSTGAWGHSNAKSLAEDLLTIISTALSQAASRRGTTLLNKALECLENLDLPATLMKLDINERRLQRLFKSELGMSAKLVQRMARLQRTLKYWNDSRHKLQSIANLAHAMGFADQAHLAREFRLLVGQPPNQLKENGDSEQDLLWALREGGRLLAPGIFGRQPRSIPEVSEFSKTL